MVHFHSNVTRRVGLICQANYNVHAMIMFMMTDEMMMMKAAASTEISTTRLLDSHRGDQAFPEHLPPRISPCLPIFRSNDERWVGR